MCGLLIWSKTGFYLISLRPQQYGKRNHFLMEIADLRYCQLSKEKIEGRFRCDKSEDSQSCSDLKGSEVHHDG